MIITDYINYFRTAAINHKVLAHAPGHETFYSIDIQDIENGMKLTNKYTSMLLECYGTKTYDALSDNIRKIQTGAFAVIKEVRLGDLASRESVLLETEEICEDILSKMLNDWRKCRQNSQYTPKINFEPESVRIDKVGPILNNQYGWRVQFILNNKFRQNLRLDPAKWNNETKF